MKPKIKICGITNQKDAHVICSSGVDYVGFVCYDKSKRYVTAEQILHISQALSDDILKVGVFVNASMEEITRVYNQAHLHIVQLHGDESESFARSLDLPFFKAIRVKEPADINIIESYKDNPYCRGILLDAFSNKNFGGTGIRVDLKIIEQALILSSKHNLNLIIAGGISKNNLKEFTNLWQNIYGFDISSSVEIEPGVKSPLEIENFFQEYHKLTTKNNTSEK